MNNPCTVNKSRQQYHGSWSLWAINVLPLAWARELCKARKQRITIHPFNQYVWKYIAACTREASGHLRASGNKWGFCLRHKNSAAACLYITYLKKGPWYSNLSNKIFFVLVFVHTYTLIELVTHRAPPRFANQSGQVLYCILVGKFYFIHYTMRLQDSTFKQWLTWVTLNSRGAHVWNR